MKRRKLWLRGALLAPAILLAACVSGGSGDQTIPLPEGTPFSPEMAARLHQIRDRALEIRELSLSREVNEETLSRDQLVAYFDALGDSVTEDERREMEAYNQAWRLLHMIGPDDDLLDLSLESDAEDILGFFVDDHDRLVLIADAEPSALNVDDEYVLSHEYIHSFQHIAFDTAKLRERAVQEEEGDPTEYGTTIECLTEGDATVAGVYYMDAVHGPGWSDAMGDDEPVDGAQEEGYPAALERYSSFNYSECARFVATLIARGGWTTVNRAYSAPPWTTEHILHPDKYLDGEGVTRMKPVDLRDRLGEKWDREFYGIFGEFDVYNYLLSVLEDEGLAAAAAAGWGVGWGSIYAERDKSGADDVNTLVHVQIEFDTPQDLGEFAFTYGLLIAKLAGDKVQTAEDGVTLCWQDDRAYGYASGNDIHKRVDIVLSTNPDMLLQATSGSLSAPTTGTCPGFS
jgi:hypothetical protein